MKCVIALLLCIALVFSGCSSQPQPQVAESDNVLPETSNVEVAEVEVEETVGFEDFEPQIIEPTYNGLSDQALLDSIEDSIYAEAVAALDSEDYVIEGVNAIYVPKSYLEELAYNSKENVFFGYTLSELDDIFQGQKYYFTLGEDGQTTVRALEERAPLDIDAIVKNVAIGTGVIFVCVTVSALTGGVAPAVSMIFAVSAKTAAITAVSSAALGGVAAGAIKGIQTGSFDEAVDAGLLAASEEFKWGAVLGGITGAGIEAFALKSATKAGLTMNEVAVIQRESKIPIDVIAQFHSMEEYAVYKKAGLKPLIVNGRTALVRDIDWFYISELPDGTKVFNIERMLKGLAPIDPATGKAYQLHHIGQKSNATLAILKESEHQGNAKILNIAGKESEIVRGDFAKTRQEFWKSFANAVLENGGI